MPIEIYHQGPQADIFSYVNNRGDCLAADFIDSLGASDQKKVVRLLHEFALRGQIVNHEKFRLENHPVYAFKSFQVRILCFFYPGASRRSLVLTHGFIKKQDRLPKSELEKALRIYKEIFEQPKQKNKP